jgi:hypothetical protein
MDKNTKTRTKRAYSAAARFTKERMTREAPLDAAALDRVEAADIVVVRGTYDHVEQVLEALELPFMHVPPDQVGDLPLHKDQLLVVNCPGHITPPGLQRIGRFVQSGGSLFSTDWALRHVIEPLFPVTVEYNGRATGDDVVRIEVKDGSSPYLAGVMEDGDDPLWWMESSSYPIRVLDTDRVRVLITSSELAARYGEPSVAVTFPAGDGEVFHMISHYYLQRTELRTRRHRSAGSVYAAERAVPVSPELARELEEVSVGEVQSAASSARMISNLIAAKKQAQGRGRRGDPDESGQ